MRIERIITAVTRTLTVNVVREIEAVRLFVRSVYFHLCYASMAQLMPAPAGRLSALACGDASASPASVHAGVYPGWQDCLGMSGCKRGKLLCQPVLVTANCRARFAKV